jgi:hypothetical protein
VGIFFLSERVAPPLILSYDSLGFKGISESHAISCFRPFKAYQDVSNKN